MNLLTSVATFREEDETVGCVCVKVLRVELTREEQPSYYIRLP
jgi:hypothetical protein